MCRRVLTHHMHHDVRAPMIVDICSPEARVYANPLRTCCHRCEVDLKRIRRDLGLPTLEQSQCEYHDCCLVQEEVWLCQQHPGAADADGDDECGEPEECEAFVLEHRHTPLCTWEVVAQWAAAAGWEQPDVLPAAPWFPYAELAWGRDWQPVYHQDPDLYTQWQETIFSLGESLHRLRADRDVHEAVLLDLTSCPMTVDWEDRATAVDNYFRVARELCMLEMHMDESFHLAAMRS